MHVAICSDGVFPEAIGGIERHTRLLVETMARLRKSVRITVIHTHPGKSLFSGLDNVAEIAVEPRAGRGTYLLECLELSTRFANVLRTLPDAVVYSQGLCVVKGIREFSERLVVNPHGLESFQTITLKDWVTAAPFRMVQRHTFKHAKRVISLGGRLTDILRAECGGDERIAILPNGVVVPNSSTHPAQPSNRPIRLLFVGRLMPNKGVPDLLEAMREIDRRGGGGRFEVNIVGGGPLLTSLTASSGRPNVKFLGKISDGELERLYGSSDALVLPTLFEGMPTVVLEAMARALPVLVTDVGASRELVDQSNGAIIPKRDPVALADAILWLESIGESGRHLLGLKGLERVRERFCWERVAQAHLNLFEQIR